MNFKDLVLENESYVISKDVDNYFKSLGFNYKNIPGDKVTMYVKDIKFNGKFIRITFTSDNDIYLQNIVNSYYWKNIDIFSRFKDIDSISIEFLESKKFYEIIKNELIKL